MKLLCQSLLFQIYYSTKNYWLSCLECVNWFVLLQAAYTVGGHSFSAAAIEYVILKMKPPLHRPQIVRTLPNNLIQLTLNLLP